MSLCVLLCVLSGQRVDRTGAGSGCTVGSVAIRLCTRGGTPFGWRGRGLVRFVSAGTWWFHLNITWES